MKRLLSLILLVLLIPMASSIPDFVPSGNIQGFDYYNIKNFTDINATERVCVGDVCITNETVFEFNASNYYSKDQYNDTNFENDTEILSIALSWFSSTFDNFFGLKTTNDLLEGNLNEYSTEARFDGNFSSKTTDDLTQGSVNFYDNQSWNEIRANTLYSNYSSGDFDSNFAAKTTDDLTQGTVNLYENKSWNESYANTLYYDISNPSGFTDYDSSDFNTDFAAKTTTDLSEGSNLYYTQGRFDSAFTAKDTDDLIEGSTNLYYTDGRVQTLGDSRYLKLDASNDPITGVLNISFDESDFNVDTIVAENTNANGVATINLQGDNGSLEIGTLGSDLTALLFSDIADEGEVVTGTLNDNGPMFISTRFNETIYFGTTETGSLADVVFDVAIDPSLSALVFEGNKFIRPVPVDGGAALVFQSTDALDEGGFPFVWVAQDSSNDTIVPQWIQNGRNNSYSGMMNSWGTVPKSWVNFGGGPTDDMEGVDFLFNTSDYTKYCDYLQDNLSLIPEDCKYFADTTGRLVPLLFGGDLEVHRSAVIHEGLTVFTDFDAISRTQQDADFINMSIHPRQFRIEEIGVAPGENFSLLGPVDFEDATLQPYVLTETGDPGDEWRAVDDSIVTDAECPVFPGAGDYCAFSQDGPNEMATNFSTENGENCRMSFWTTTNGLDGNDDYVITLSDGITSQVVFSITNGADVTDLLVDVDVSGFDNTSLLTSYVTLNATGNADEANIDEIQVYCDAITDTRANVTRTDSLITFGDGTLADDGLPIYGIYYNDSSNEIVFRGNASFDNIQENELNVTTTITAAGDITSTGGDIITETGEFVGNMNWTNLQNYPAACPGSGSSQSYITGLGDSTTCTAISSLDNTNIQDIYLFNTGDSFTGLYELTGSFKINGTEVDPTAGGTGTVTQVDTTAPITGGPITSTGTIGITQATTSTDGYLSSTDWNTFNNKQGALTNGVDSLTSAEVSQLANIGTATISATQWGYLGDQDQSVAQDQDVTFENVVVSDTLTVLNLLDVANVTGSNVSGSLIPDLNNVFDLGSPSYAWRNGYFGNRVGIGTTSPSAKLDVAGTSEFNGNMEIFGASGSGRELRIRAETNTEAVIKAQGSQVRFVYEGEPTGANKLYFDRDESGSTTMALDGSGNVGIATTSPDSKLELGNADGTQGSLLLTGQGSNNANGGNINWKESDGGTTVFTLQHDGDANTLRFRSNNIDPILTMERTTGEVKFAKTASFETEFNNGNCASSDTINWKNGNKQKSTLTGSCTYTFTAPSGVGNFLLKIVQDATGSRTVTWPSSVNWPGGTAPTLTTAANAIDIVSCYYDGSEYFCQAGLDFK